MEYIADIGNLGNDTSHNKYNYNYITIKTTDFRLSDIIKL